jgi:hypothetical protein
MRKFKTIAQKEKEKKPICISLCFDWRVQFWRLKACSHVSFHPFLFSFSWIFRKCYTFLQICLGKFDENIFQAFAHSFLINSCILTSLKKGMSKTYALKSFIHTQSFTIDYQIWKQLSWYLNLTFHPSHKQFYSLLI